MVNYKTVVPENDDKVPSCSDGSSKVRPVWLTGLGPYVNKEKPVGPIGLSMLLRYIRKFRG